MAHGNDLQRARLHSEKPWEAEPSDCDSEACVTSFSCVTSHGCSGNRTVPGSCGASLGDLLRGRRWRSVAASAAASPAVTGDNLHALRKHVSIATLRHGCRRQQEPPAVTARPRHWNGPVQLCL